jgi:hypothetical protein
VTCIVGEDHADEETELLQFPDAGSAVAHLRRAAGDIVADEIRRGTGAINLTLSLLDAGGTEIFSLRTLAAVEGSHR